MRAPRTLYSPEKILLYRDAVQLRVGPDGKVELDEDEQYSLDHGTMYIVNDFYLCPTLLGYWLVLYSGVN